jgi:hypothetical protein
MGAREMRLAATWIAVVLASGSLAAQEKLSDLQARFDHDTNAIHKAKLLERLGDAQFEDARRAEKDNDYTTVGLTMEKYRDNVRAAADALKKEHPDGERHPAGYKQLEMHVQKGLREVGEIILIIPQEYKPPLQIVRHDLLVLDDQLLRALFPRRPGDKPLPPPPRTKPPGSEKDL